MADLTPMLGAILSVAHTKTKHGKAARKTPVAVAAHVPMTAEPTPMSDKKLMKENAKHTLRRATDDWVEGRITTKEHKAVHERTKHVLAGKAPREFKGMSGERSFKKLR